MRRSVNSIYKFCSKPEYNIQTNPTILYIKDNDSLGPIQAKDQELLNVFPNSSLA